mmetsp:Transcript_100649/g.123241  ORF Transcript_100649/g.123241 Transcript_100649/m.123241 type:complete len:96 (+) Transcript_100649:93-380(+)
MPRSAPLQTVEQSTGVLQQYIRKSATPMLSSASFTKLAWAPQMAEPGGHRCSLDQATWEVSLPEKLRLLIWLKSGMRQLNARPVMPALSKPLLGL